MNSDFSECEGQYCHELPTSQLLIFLCVSNKQTQKLDHLTSLMKLSNTSTTITEILWLLVCVELSTRYLFAVIAHMSNYNKLGLGMILLLPALMGIFFNRVFNLQGTAFLENEWQEVHILSGRIFKYIRPGIQSIMACILYTFQGPLWHLFSYKDFFSCYDYAILQSHVSLPIKTLRRCK